MMVMVLHSDSGDDGGDGDGSSDCELGMMVMVLLSDSAQK